MGCDLYIIGVRIGIKEMKRTPCWTMLITTVESDPRNEVTGLLVVYPFHRPIESNVEVPSRIPSLLYT